MPTVSFQPNIRFEQSEIFQFLSNDVYDCPTTTYEKYVHTNIYLKYNTGFCPYKETDNETPAWRHCYLACSLLIFLLTY